MNNERASASQWQLPLFRLKQNISSTKIPLALMMIRQSIRFIEIAEQNITRSRAPVVVECRATYYLY